MGIFYRLIDLFETDFTRAAVATAGILLLIGLLSWISIIDIKRKSITFWKMLVVGFAEIMVCFIGSFFCGCGILKWFILGSLPIWLFILFINVKFNKDRFIGKADIDLLSALFAELIVYSMWIYKVSANSQIAWVKISHVWYLSFLYLLIGALIFTGIVLAIFLIRKLVFKTSLKELVKSKVSVIPMFVPVSIAIPLIILLS